MRYFVNKSGRLEGRIFRDGTVEIYDFQTSKLLNHVYKIEGISIHFSCWFWGVRRIPSFPNFCDFRIDFGPISLHIERVRQRARPDDLPEKTFD